MIEKEPDPIEFGSLIKRLEREMISMKDGLINDGLDVDFYSHRHASTVHSMGISACVEKGTILLAVNVFISSGKMEVGANIQSDFQLPPDKSIPAFFRPYSKSDAYELSQSLAALCEKFGSIVRDQK